LQSCQTLEDPHEQLRKFRETHSYTQRYVRGIRWEYILCGRGEETLLLLPGSPGLGEVAFQLILRFEHIYRIISPGYPAGITTVAGLVDGLVDIMTCEQISQVYIVGGSYSGMIAQQFVRLYPEKVKILVLDHAGVPRRDRTKKYKCYRCVISILPLFIIRSLLKLGKTLSMLSMPVYRSFWNAYFDEIIATLKKEDYLSRVQVCIDFDQNYTFTGDDLLHWPGDMLIIESDNDPYVSSQEREALRALYTKAQVHTFHNTSHFAWATEVEAFLDVIEHFLRDGK
jgi:pimeloyl-ACP methyl ester carboxylesterase